MWMLFWPATGAPTNGCLRHLCHHHFHHHHHHHQQHMHHASCIMHHASSIVMSHRCHELVTIVVMNCRHHDHDHDNHNCHNDELSWLRFIMNHHQIHQQNSKTDSSSSSSYSSNPPANYSTHHPKTKPQFRLKVPAHYKRAAWNLAADSGPDGRVLRIAPRFAKKRQFQKGS